MQFLHNRIVIEMREKMSEAVYGRGPYGLSETSTHVVVPTYTLGPTLSFTLFS